MLIVVEHRTCGNLLPFGHAFGVRIITSIIIIIIIITHQLFCGANYIIKKRLNFLQFLAIRGRALNLKVFVFMYHRLTVSVL